MYSIGEYAHGCPLGFVVLPVLLGQTFNLENIGHPRPVISSSLCESVHWSLDEMKNAYLVSGYYSFLADSKRLILIKNAEHQVTNVASILLVLSPVPSNTCGVDVCFGPIASGHNEVRGHNVKL